MLAQKNGRTGQPQHGVDIYGSPRPERDLLYGVQCKGKDRNYGAKATVGELENELAKAEKFTPSLAHWIFATSAFKDGKLQQKARELSAERIAKGLFSVAVLGWEDIQSLLAQHPDVILDFYPEHAFDISGLLKALREFPSGEEVRELREQIRSLNEARYKALTTHEDSQWDFVSFAGQRDLGPALLGRGLGPGDARACPRLQEADMIVAQLRRAYSARLIGEPGSGKSVCAYQTAADFASAGWSVLRIRDASAVDPTSLPPDDPCLLLLDDAHLMSCAALQQIEEAAGPRRLVLSIHNGIEGGPTNRGAVIIDPKRAVRTIAEELQAHPEQTLAAVRRADDDVGDDFLKVPLERRIDDAATHSDRPWQFCFVLGGGWRRAKEAAQAARIKGADLVLAAAGIIQLASRDAPLGPERLRDFCEQNAIPTADASRAISWLVSQRLLLSDTDCRCPHQRFALVVLGRIIEGQDSKGRTTISGMLSTVVRDPRFPIAGLRLLLHELRFIGEYPRRWTGLVQAKALEPLIARCWRATNSDDRAFAAYLFSDLDAYVDGWYERVRQDHVPTIAEWITAAAPPTAYGLKNLLNALRNRQAATVAQIIKAVNPEAIAHTLSIVTPASADHCAELIGAIGWERPDEWKMAFNQAFNRDAVITLAQTWPSSAPLYAFARFCAALNAWDDELGLAMVEAFIPTAQRAFANDPVSAFQELEDIADHVLRLSDPLGVYKGKLAPNRQRFALGKAMCAALKPKILAAQLSDTPRRDFQSATFFLAFLKKANNLKFKATVEAIDWPRIAHVIGDDWANLSHQEEIFLTVSYSSEIARSLIAKIVVQNLNRIDKFSPRLAVMTPEIAIRHIEAGKSVRLGQHQHFEFQFGAILIAQLATLRPDLIERVLAPFEKLAGEAWSGQNASWFQFAPMFVEVVREAAPASLQRMLSAVDVTKAEAGWIDSLQKPSAARDAVALLIESALSRQDRVGDMARRLRKKYRTRSVPKKRRRRRPMLHARFKAVPS